MPPTLSVVNDKATLVENVRELRDRLVLFKESRYLVQSTAKDQVDEMLTLINEIAIQTNANKPDPAAATAKPTATLPAKP